MDKTNFYKRWLCVLTGNVFFGEGCKGMRSHERCHAVLLVPAPTHDEPEYQNVEFWYPGEFPPDLPLNVTGQVEIVWDGESGDILESERTLGLDATERDVEG